MSKTKNSELAQQVFDALFKVIGRRTLDSFAVQILKTTVEKLEKKYDLLAFVTIHEDFFSEGTQTTYDPQFDASDSPQLGEAVNALLRVIYIELTETIGKDAGLYFITELKQHLGEASVDELRGIGVEFERIQSEQQSLYQNGKIPVTTTLLPKKESEKSLYTWDTVATWRYNNNICLLYDEQGRLLDTLQLDLIIEEYVERVTESQRQHQMVGPQTTMKKITEKEQELLSIMQRRDIDIQSAVTLLHTSRQKFDAMVKKLLQLEMLQYQSENEVKLTEKGLQYLSNAPKK
jgi:predicted transcriptional regulator